MNMETLFSVDTSILWLKHLLIQTQSSRLMAIGTVELYAYFDPPLGIAEHCANTCHASNSPSKHSYYFINEFGINQRFVE